MGFEKWLEMKNEVVSDSCSGTVDELYAQYVYEENRELSDSLLRTAYSGSWFD